MRNKLLCAFLFALVLPVAHAGEAVPTEADVALEVRVTALAGELRCLVCQNQTIADSRAPLAIDLKNQVREMLQQGKSDQEIKNYMVTRYGDFVLYRPQMKATTWILWFGPLTLLVLALAVLVVKLRQRRKAIQQKSGLSADEHSRAAALLSETGEGECS